VLGGIGGLLVGSSMWRLGVTGTYLGDYFGILVRWGCRRWGVRSTVWHRGGCGRGVRRVLRRALACLWGTY